MTNTFLPPLTLALGLLATVANAHGYVQGVVADGTYYQGYRPSFQYLASPPVIPSWSDPLNIDNGYIKNYTSPDIICHLGATPGKTHATVRAGGSVKLQWTNWPEGHLGPVVTYLANCNGNCTNVDKTKLLFNKIDEAGLLQGGYSPGLWAASELIKNNNSWTVQIPENIAPGQYVLRHEIISLQEAMVYGGAQNYPQCVNILVTGSGTNSLQSGTLGTSLYTRDDPGIKIDIYRALNNYTIPGPALISGAGGSTQPGSNSTTTILMTSTSTPTSTSSVSSNSSVSGVFSTSSTSLSSIISSTSSIASSISSTSSGATISISFSLSSTSSSVGRSSLSAAGQAFYSVSTSTTQTTSTSTGSETSTSDTSLSATSPTTSTSSTASLSSSVSTTMSESSSTTMTVMSAPTTLQTVTVSDSSISAGIFLGSVTANVSTTLVRITVTVPGNFADPPSPTNATLTTSSFTNATSTPYPFTNSTLSPPYPYNNGTATFLNGTGTAYSTGFATAYSASGTITQATGTGATFVVWAPITTSSASIDNGYKPRRNVRYVKPRQWQI